jgi:hypothetical protein
MKTVTDFDRAGNSVELSRRLSKRILREVVSLRLDGQPIHNRRLIKKLGLARKRPTVAKAVLALVVNYLGEIGVAVEVR